MNKSRAKPSLVAHLTRNIIFGLVFILLALFVGMCGYHCFEHLAWIDAFADAAMILSGMGPLKALTTTAGKIFAGCYALFSGLVFLVVIALVLSPLIHTFLVKVHIEGATMSSDKHNPTPPTD